MTSSAPAASAERAPLSRPMALGTHGVISTGHALATQAGLRVLQDGGNAVDAALAASAVLAVVRPHAATLGGDLFALVHDGQTGEVVAINASGPAPQAATVEWFRAHGYQTMPPQGLLSIEVPGYVDGWTILHERFATWTASDLLQPAIQCAADGFPVYPKLADESARHARLLAQDAAAAALFLPGGEPLRTGHLLVQRDLAECLALIARDGRRAYYGGPLGAAIGGYVQRAGGLLAESDLDTPPVSQGFVLLDELNIANGLDLHALGHNSADAIHLMVETKKLAFADRLAYLGDPSFVALPLDALLSPEHAARQRARIDPRRAAREPVAAYDLAPKGSDTTYLCVVDAAGNAVSLIESIYSAWGSGVVVPGTGILMNNRMLGFWLADGHPNQLAPGKRAMHTLNAFLLKRGAELFMVGGTPGADDQVQTNFQVLVNIIDFGMNVQEALDATKWSSRPGTLEGDQDQPYVLAVEPRLDEAIVRELAARGHRIQRVPDYTIGAHEAIVRDLETGVLMGGAAPTRDGYAL